MLARAAVAELGLTSPIDAELVASYRGIARVEIADIPWAGCLLSQGGQLVARLRASDTRGRQRFTALHEVIHTYLPGFSTAAAHYRCEPTHAPVDVTRDRHIEQLCDIGASELLYPAEPFRADMAGRPPTLTTVHALAERYDGSFEATARRYTSLYDVPTMLIGLELATAPRHPTAVPALRVQWVHATGGWPFVPQHKSVPDDSPFGRALAGEIVDEISDITEPACQPLRAVRISARVCPYTDSYGQRHERVMALVTRPKGS